MFNWIARLFRPKPVPPTDHPRIWIALDRRVKELKAEIAKAKARVVGLETKLEQLEKLPDEAFSILLS